jgi:hypothetical protein
VTRDQNLKQLKLFATFALVFGTVACTPSARMRTEQSLVKMDSIEVGCISVKTPSTALKALPEFKTERDERIFNAELRMASIYFAERMASELKQLEDHRLDVKRTGTCQHGLVLKTTITEFNPGKGFLIGGMTMGFGADLKIENAASKEQLALFSLHHGKGLNAISSGVSMISPVPVVGAVGDMPSLLDSLVEKALGAIEQSFEKKQAQAK